MKRLTCLCLLACLLITLLPAEPAAAQLPVTDVAVLAQAVVDHVKRLFEIAQKVVMIANQVQELDYWFHAMLKMGQIPYRRGVLDFLVLQGDLLREYDDLRGQYQALSHSLQEVWREFDITFPGWRAVSDMAAGAALRVQSEAGNYTFNTPREYERYQAARALQSVRQTLIAAAEDQANVRESQGHLGTLKEAMPSVEGHQQALEMQTSFAAIGAEQLVALRQSQLALTMIIGNLGAHRLNAQMELGASQEVLSRDLEHALVQEFGALVPVHTGANGMPPLPLWANPW